MAQFPGRKLETQCIRSCLESADLVSVSYISLHCCSLGPPDRSARCHQLSKCVKGRVRHSGECREGCLNVRGGREGWIQALPRGETHHGHVPLVPVSLSKMETRSLDSMENMEENRNHLTYPELPLSLLRRRTAFIYIDVCTQH